MFSSANNTTLSGHTTNNMNQRLDLHKQIADTNHFRQVCTALENNTTVTYLDLSGNIIEQNEIIYLAKVLKVNTCLTHLNLRYTSIDDQKLTDLAETLKINKTLTYLNLVANDQIGHEGFKALTHALTVNESLTYLDLSGSNLPLKTRDLFDTALKNNSALLEVRGITSKNITECLERNKKLTALSIPDLNLEQKNALVQHYLELLTLVQGVLQPDSTLYIPLELIDISIQKLCGLSYQDASHLRIKIQSSFSVKADPLSTKQRSYFLFSPPTRPDQKNAPSQLSHSQNFRI